MPIRPTTALCALALLALRPTDVELSFAPAEGAVLTRTFVYTSETAIDELSVQVDGEDLSEMLGAFSFEVEGIQTYAVTDEIVGVEDGRIRELRRTFDTLSGESEVQFEAAMTSQGTDTSASSVLEGESVVFEWDDELDEYTARADEGSDVDEDLLQRLEMSMDLASLLPEDDVQEGGSWEIDLAALGAISMPGGSLALMPDEPVDGVEGLDQQAMAEMMADYQERALEMLDDWVDGEIRGTLNGTGEEDGRSVAQIELELDLAFEADLSDLVQDMLEEFFSQMDLPMEVDFSIDRVEVTADVEGEGDLTWDLEAHHGRSLRLLVEYDFEVEVEVSVDAQGESHEFAAQVAGSGLAKSEVTIE